MKLTIELKIYIKASKHNIMGKAKAVDLQSQLENFIWV